MVRIFVEIVEHLRQYTDWMRITQLSQAFKAFMHCICLIAKRGANRHCRLHISNKFTWRGIKQYNVTVLNCETVLGQCLVLYFNIWNIWRFHFLKILNWMLIWLFCYWFDFILCCKSDSWYWITQNRSKWLINFRVATNLRVLMTFNYISFSIHSVIVMHRFNLYWCWSTKDIVKFVLISLLDYCALFALSDR